MSLTNRASQKLNEDGPVEFAKAAGRYGKNRVRRTADTIVGRQIYKCNSNTRRCLEGQAKFLKSRQFSDVDVPFHPHPGLKDGHILDLGKIYDDKLIETIREKFNTAVDEDGDSVYHVQHEGTTYSKQLYSFEFSGTPAYDFATHIPELGELFTDDVKAALKQYYGGWFAPTYMRVYRNYHVPQEVIQDTEMYSSYWHCDGNGIDGIKLFVTLNEVTESHGPFHIISRDDTKELYGPNYDREKEGVPNNIVERNADTILKHTGPPGTAMLGNSQLCMHRAGYPDEGNVRDLVMIQLRASTKPFSDDWLRSPEYPLERYVTV